MNKLEELKAAIDKYDSLSYEYHHMREALSSGNHRDLYFRTYQARVKKEKLKDELLLDLIAVAEAAKEMMNKMEVKLYTHGSGGCSYAADKIAPYDLLTKLLPLTKDTDK